MKRFIRLIKVIVLLVSVLIPNARAQDKSDLMIQGVDTRIWSQSYWIEMAKLGLVEVPPAIQPKEAIYTSSEIVAPGVTAQDSPDVPVTTDPNTTQSENSVFVHPNDIHTLLNSNNSTDWDGSQVPSNGFYGADAFNSTDGGETWGGNIFGVGGMNGGDPSAVIGLNGWFYVGYITENGGQGIAHSTDNGNSWTHVQVADPGIGPSDLLDKNHLWIDNKTMSPYEGNLYCAWTKFETGSPDDGEIELSMSTDDGLNWSSPIVVSSTVSVGSHNQGVNIKTGPNGEVYVIWAVYDSWPSDEIAIGFTKSTDGGGSFDPANKIISNIRGVRDSGTSKDMRVNSFPVMAVDISGGPNDGTIYVAWTNVGIPGVNVGPDIEVYLIKSTDGGSIWSTPLKVNQDPSGLGKEHYLPWLTCDPVTGDLSTIFYDDRNVSSTDCEVFVATSQDAGENWVDFKVSDVSFTPSPVPGLAMGYFGDYLGISARAGEVYPVWTDNREGRALTYVSPFSLNGTEVSGDVYGTWTSEDSPYLVVGDINVPSGSYLIIEPGVDVIFDGNYYFSIYGLLLAQGAEETPITFAPMDDAVGWGGLQFRSQDPSILDHCIVRDCNSDAIQCSHSSPGIYNCDIYGNSGSGIYCYYSNALIEGCKVYRNYLGIEVRNSSYPTILNCLIYDNHTGGGINVSSSEPSIWSCTIYGNSAGGDGGGFYGWGGITWITNCIFWNNYPDQIDTYWNHTLYVKYSDVEGGWGGEGNINSNPLFVNAPVDFYLSQIAAGQPLQSPCVDAGDPSSQMIIGTTRTDGVQDDGIIDMGYHYDYDGFVSSDVTVDLDPINPPIVIPDTGGSFDFDLFLENPTTDPQSIDLWCTIEIPGGSQFTVLGPLSGTLPPGFSITRLRTQFVPDYAPEGYYRYWAFVGEYPWSVIDSDYFPFTKEGGGNPLWTPPGDGWDNIGGPLFWNLAAQ